ncbi:phenylacetyl-CoA ligase [Sparassis latifolia]
MSWEAPLGPLPVIPDDLTVVQFMLDHDHISRPAMNPDQTWLIEDATGRRITMGEIRTRTAGLANAFSSRWKISEDDVVCIYSPNHVDYATVIWATHRLGAIITAANPSYTADELEYQISATHAKLMVVHPWSYTVGLEAARKAGLAEDCIVLLDPLAGVSYPTVHELIADGLATPSSFVERRLNPGENRTKLAFLSFSSGTTGRPKAVCIPHSAPIANVIQMSHTANSETVPWEDQIWRTGDVALGALPFYHIYGLVVVMHFHLFYGMSLVVIPKFNFVELLKSVQRHRINYMSIVPPMVVLLCKHPAVKDYDLTSIRAIMCGAAPLSAELTSLLATVLPRSVISQGYGMTETCTTVTFPQLGQKVGTPGSAGRLLPGVVARVVRADGTPVGYNEPGELVVHSPSCALRYLDNEEATRETFRDGWVHTGDEVMINESKEMFVLDRIKELLKVKGFQVAPAELEGHLLNHPDVTDVCVIGIPDDYSGELPMAFIVPSAPAAERMKQGGAAEVAKTKAAIMKHVADVKVQYKHLAGGVEFADVIPKNPSGKLLRRFMRDRAREMLKQGKLSIPKPARAKL